MFRNLNNNRKFWCSNCKSPKDLIKIDQQDRGDVEIQEFVCKKCGKKITVPSSDSEDVFQNR